MPWDSTQLTCCHLLLGRYHPEIRQRLESSLSSESANEAAIAVASLTKALVSGLQDPSRLSPTLAALGSGPAQTCVQCRYQSCMPLWVACPLRLSGSQPPLPDGQSQNFLLHDSPSRRATAQGHTTRRECVHAQHSFDLLYLNAYSQ